MEWKKGKSLKTKINQSKSKEISYMNNTTSHKSKFKQLSKHHKILTQTA